jgi:hypothetical protein
MDVTAMTAAAFTAARAFAGGACVNIRHKGNTYRGMRGALSARAQIELKGQLQAGSGFVRLLASELRPPAMESGHLIEVEDGTWQKRRIDSITYDQPRATVRVSYVSEAA